MNGKLKKILRKLALFVPLAVLPALLMMAIAAVGGGGIDLEIEGGSNNTSTPGIVTYDGSEYKDTIATIETYMTFDTTSKPHASVVVTDDLILNSAVITGGYGNAFGDFGGNASLSVDEDFTAEAVTLTGGAGGNASGGNGSKGGDASLTVDGKLDVKNVTLTAGNDGADDDPYDGGAGGGITFIVGTYYAAKDYELSVKETAVTGDVACEIGQFEFNLDGAAATDILLYIDAQGDAWEFFLTLSHTVSLTGTPNTLSIGDTITLIDGVDGSFTTDTLPIAGYTFEISKSGDKLIAKVISGGGNQSSSPSPTPRPNYYTYIPEEDLHIDVTLERETLEWKIKVTGAGTKTVKVDAAIVPWKSLRGMQAAQTRGYEMVISLDVFVDGVKTNAPMTVSLPYTLKRGEDPKAVRIWHMDDNGNLADLKAVYNKETGMITFKINHQSFFVMGYEPVTLWTNRFNDIKGNEWYYDAVAYANCYGIFEGSDGNFMPTESMTRAMFAVMLWKLDGRPALVGRDTPGALSFDDVSPDMWYHGAVVWAAENGIASGDDLYYPESPITRQEMAVMLYNYMNFKGYEIPKYRTLADFADKDEFDEWAEIPAKELAQAYVISGSGNRFRPLDTATRADVAKILENFLRFVAPPR